MSFMEDSEGSSSCPKRQKIAEECLEESNLHIFDLPEEVLLKILSYLSTYEILLRVGLVCKRFNDLSKVPTLIEELSYNENIDTFALNSFSDVLKSSKNLKKLCSKSLGKQVNRFLKIAPNSLNIFRQQLLRNELKRPYGPYLLEKSTRVEKHNEICTQ